MYSAYFSNVADIVSGTILLSGSHNSDLSASSF